MQTLKHDFNLFKVTIMYSILNYYVFNSYCNSIVYLCFLISYNTYIYFNYHAVSVSLDSHPITRWAQRKDRVFVEVQLRDILNENIELTENTLTFVGQSDKDKYAFNFEFYASVDKEASKWNKTGYHLMFVLEKKDKDASFWPRLLKGKEKNQYVQVDWSKWVDED